MRTPSIRAAILIALPLLGCSSTAGPGPVAGERLAKTASAPPEPLMARDCRPRGARSIRALAGSRASSVVALAADADRTVAFVADEEGQAIVAYDVDAGQAIATTELDGAPAQLLVLVDGRIAVTLREAGRIVVLEAERGSAAPLVERCRAGVAAEPIAIAATPDGRTLVVASGWSHRLGAFDPATLAPSWDVDLAREPRAVVIDDRGESAFVSHAVGSQISEIDLARHGVTPVDLHRDPVGGRWNAGGVRESGQGYALVHANLAPRPELPARGFLFAPAATVDPGKGVVSTEVYGPADGAPVLPMVHVVDEERGRLVSTDGGSFEGRGTVAERCNLPRAAALAGSSLFVACLGIDAVLELDARTANPMNVELRRFSVPRGPTGVAIDAAHGRAVVWSSFAHRLAVIALDPKAPRRPVATIDAPARSSWLAGRLARGRELFHATSDPRISKDGRACATCHVEGRDDGMVWATPDGPRQTIHLAGRVASTAPFGWTGARRELTGHIRDTWRRLGGRGVFSDGDHEDLEALAAYVASMKAPPPSAPLRSSLGADPTLVARGRTIFEGAGQGCGSCHPGGHTDGLAHDVGSDAFHRPFDTPSLRFVGSTAPYFHDGRYATLDELVRSVDGKMGHTAHLSDDDRRALVAYLETL